MSNQANVGIAGHSVDTEDMRYTPADLESPPEIDKSVLGWKFLTILPYGGLTENGPYDFHCDSMSTYYMDLSSARLKGTVQVKKLTSNVESNIPDDEDVSIVNLIGNSIFNNVECTVQGTPVTDSSSQTYHYKAMIDTILSHGWESKSSHLETNRYYDETKDTYSTVQKSSGGKTPYDTRMALIKGSAKLPFLTTLHIDLFNGPRYGSYF